MIFVKRPREILETLIEAKAGREEIMRDDGTPVSESVIHNSAENVYDPIIDAFIVNVTDVNISDAFNDVEKIRATGDSAMKGVLPGDQVSILPLVVFLANAPGDARVALPIPRACNINGVAHSEPAVGSYKVPPRVLFTFPKGLTKKFALSTTTWFQSDNPTRMFQLLGLLR